MASAQALTSLIRHITKTEPSIDPDSIFDLIYAVPSKVRFDSTFKILESSRLAIAKLRDGCGRYLAGNSESNLVGYPVEWVNYLPGGAVIAFGPQENSLVPQKIDGVRCKYCGVSVTVGDKFCRDGCGAPR